MSLCFPISIGSLTLLQITVISKSPLLSIPTVRDTVIPSLESSFQSIKIAASESRLNPPEGSHSTCDDGIKTLAGIFQLKKGDVVWDIGVGNPTMAMFFSLLTEKPVVGTDTGEYLECLY